MYVPTARKRGKRLQHDRMEHGCGNILLGNLPAQEILQVGLGKDSQRDAIG